MRNEPAARQRRRNKAGLWPKALDQIRALIKDQGYMTKAEVEALIDKKLKQQ